MQRKSFGGQTRGLALGRTDDRGRIVTVGLPTPYEGVGNALRSAYSPPHDSLPADMMALLSAMDGR